MKDKKPLNKPMLILFVIAMLLSINFFYDSVSQEFSMNNILSGTACLVAGLVLFKGIRNSKKDYAENWEKERKKGKMYYMFIFGPFLWAVPTMIPLWLTEGSFSIKELIIKLTIYLPLGILFGLWIWHIQEKRYQKYHSDDIDL